MSGVLSVVLGAVLACQAGEPTVVRTDSTYRQLFESGQSFATFLAGAERRKEQWEKNYRDAVVPDALLARARGAGGPWKLLVVAVDGCSDSVSTIPYLARLVGQLMGVELRIVGSDAGRAIMEAHRTPDGRAATPTVLLLDANYVERGAWVERPAELQQLMSGQQGKRDDNAIFEGKRQWYEKNAGAATIEEIIGLMERARS